MSSDPEEHVMAHVPLDVIARCICACYEGGDYAVGLQLRFGEVFPQAHVPEEQIAPYIKVDLLVLGVLV